METSESTTTTVEVSISKNGSELKEIVCSISKLTKADAGIDQPRSQEISIHILPVVAGDDGSLNVSVYIQDKLTKADAGFIN